MTAAPQNVHSNLATFPPPNFDRLVHVYRWLEWATFGPYLDKCRCAFLSDLPDFRRALVIGDGDGRFAARLLAAYPEIEVDAVDASPAMLRALVRRSGPNSSRVRSHCADARHFDSSGKQYDLVVTHFFLDCLKTEEVRALSARLRESVSPSGHWLISEFAIPESGVIRPVASLVIRALYLAFAALTGLRIRALPDHPMALRHAGFHLARRQTWLRGLLIGELWSCKPPDSAQTSASQTNQAFRMLQTC